MSKGSDGMNRCDGCDDTGAMPVTIIVGRLVLWFCCRPCGANWLNDSSDFVHGVMTQRERLSMTKELRPSEAASEN